MIAFQPGFLNPVQAARLSASLQRATSGRTVYNIITGGGGPAQLWWGDSFSHDDRYGRTTEFLDVLKGVWKEENFNYRRPLLPGRGRRPGTASGARGAARDLVFRIIRRGAAVGGEARRLLSLLARAFDQLTEKFARVKERTAALGRQQKCAIRVDLVARATEEEAWADIRAGFENVSDETRARWRGQPTDSVARSVRPRSARPRQSAMTS